MTDSVLEAIAAHNRALQQIAIIFCQNVTDKVIRISYFEVYFKFESAESSFQISLIGKKAFH